MSKRKNKKFKGWLIAGAVVVVLGLIGYQIVQNANKRMIDSMETFVIEPGTIILEALASGKITSADSEDVTFNGTFRRTTVELGDTVAKDDKIGEYVNNLGQLIAIRANRDGLITQVPSAVMSKFEISNPDKFQLDIQITERDIYKIALGQSATIYVEAVNESYIGEVTKISSLGNTSGDFTTYTVTVGFDHGETSVYLGMSGSAKIVLETFENIAVVPVEALITSDGKRYLLSADWLDNANLPQSDYYIPVTTGVADIYDIEVIADDLIGKTIIILPETGDNFPFFQGNRND
ncbi:MAG: HlyD family efflux transporter periplasmic adaptor subunit [Erysipelotrichaceae bacterium]|nr:HlyD family efflux transporter periplasmic adaptor subunit [Erysipelotrichaceae bacterium]